MGESFKFFFEKHKKYNRGHILFFKFKNNKNNKKIKKNQKIYYKCKSIKATYCIRIV